MPGQVDFFHADACKTLDSQKGQANLVFMDPPFNIGENYDVYYDRLTRKEYLDRLKLWLSYAYDAIRDDGSVWLHLPDEWAGAGQCLALDYDFKIENWIIWHYRFGQNRPDRFISSKCHGFWLSKGSPVVNEYEAYVPSDRAALYDDSRSVTGERMDLDVWGFEKYWGRVQGNSKERRPLHPNQLPEVYLSRIIRVTTNPGDLVVDPFCGSGTTAVVASALERRCVTGDVSEAYLASAMERLTKVGAIRV